MPPVAPVIPGASATRESGFRPLIGMLMMVWFSTTCPSVADVVLSSGAGRLHLDRGGNIADRQRRIDSRLLLHFETERRPRESS